MHIWIVNHYADPPDGQATRSFDIARHMVSRGHVVTIFASNFSHYQLAERRRILSHRLWAEETVDGVRFIWLRTIPYWANDWRRAMNMLSFALVAVARGSIDRDRPDAVIGVSVHPLAALAGYALSVIRRARFFCEITDLWPQTLIEFGRLKPTSPVVRVMRGLERFLYKRANRIIMLWRHTDAYVESLGVSPSKILWIPHGVDLRHYGALKPYSGGSRDHLQVMFLGGFAAANSIDTILEAAAVLQRRGRSSIRFVLVGSGHERPAMIALSDKLQLKNVEFRDAVPKADLAQVMNEADAFIYGLKDLPLYRYGISLNKVTDYLAAGRPIVFFGNSSYDPVADARAGISVPPGDPVAVAEALEQLSRMSCEDRAEMGLRGRAYLLDNHHIPKLADRLLASLSAP
jgi:glycosyltransferase involved in cell wall biosynthesis